MSATRWLVNIVHGQRRLGDVMRNFSDISKAQKVLGWKPELDLRRGLELTFECFR